MYVRCKWEADFTRYLKYPLEHGTISAWSYEEDTFQFPVKRGTSFYTPDFRITNPDGSIEYYEVKGYMDAKSATQLKRMAKYYPDKKIRIIDEVFFKGLRRQGFHRVIPSWE